MKISKRLKLCVEILFLRSGHKHSAQEKQISVFQNGYKAGLNDCKVGDAQIFTEEELERVYHCVRVAFNRLNEVIHQSGKVFEKETFEHMEKSLVEYDEILKKLGK